MFEECSMCCRFRWWGLWLQVFYCLIYVLAAPMEFWESSNRYFTLKSHLAVIELQLDIFTQTWQTVNTKTANVRYGHKEVWIAGH